MFTADDVQKFVGSQYPFVRLRDWKDRPVWAMEAGEAAMGLPIMVIEENGKLRELSRDEVSEYLNYAELDITPENYLEYFTFAEAMNGMIPENRLLVNGRIRDYYKHTVSKRSKSAKRPAGETPEPKDTD